MKAILIKDNIGFALLIFTCLLSGCQKAEVKTSMTVLDLPSVPYTYSSDTINSNIPTLGRVLFYDPRLSVNNSVSCSSCHKQGFAFADHNPKSLGFENRSTFRNSMPIQNLGSRNPFMGTPSLFWDGRETLLNAMVLRPITNHVEMGISDMNALNAKIAALQDYRALFVNAFGSPEVTTMKIGSALAEFLESISSKNTRFDRFLQGDSVLTPLELEGHELFFAKYNCNNCHQVEVPNGYQFGGGFVNIGLDRQYADPGFADVSGDPRDNGKFKIPTLRNILLTAPYMHDGRFATLDEVLNHYSHGIQDHPNLDLRLQTGESKPLRMNISDQEKQAIVAFLGTLTDYTMITDPRFSNPFHTN